MASTKPGAVQIPEPIAGKSQPIRGKLLMTIMATSRLVHIQEKAVARIQPGQDPRFTWFIETSQ